MGYLFGVCCHNFRSEYYLQVTSYWRSNWKIIKKIEEEEEKEEKKIKLTEEQKDEVDNVKKKVEEYDQINSKDEVEHTGEKMREKMFWK